MRAAATRAASGRPFYFLMSLLVAAVTVYRQNPMAWLAVADWLIR